MHDMKVSPGNVCYFMVLHFILSMQVLHLSKVLPCFLCFMRCIQVYAVISIFRPFSVVLYRILLNLVCMSFMCTLHSNPIPIAPL